MNSRDTTAVEELQVPSAESTYREVNGVRLHVVTAGNPGDPLVVLLHGFPEFWYGWRKYVGPLVKAGYRVLVPDQRGYNQSDKPDGVRPYRLGELSLDMVELIETEDRETAHVVGHDWGAMVAWDLALRYPDFVGRLCIANVPHPTVFAETLRSNPTQLRKSWYMFYFQLPRVPEWFLEYTDYEFWVAAMVEGSNPNTFSETDIEHYRRAWKQEGAPTAMTNWYRALFRYRDTATRDRVTAPTLVIWGENDQALIPRMAPESVDYCDDGHLERFPDATHWVTHEYPDRVADLLCEHLDG